MISMLKGWKVAFLACKHVFYRPQYNADVRCEGLEMQK